MNAILVGYGLAAQIFHAPLLKATHINVAAIVVKDPKRRKLAAQNEPTALLCDSLTQALAQSDAPLVILATPTATHAPLAIEALQAKRHVVVDKPVALTQLEFASMIQAANLNQKHLFPFQNRRWDADFLTLKDLVTHNKLGEIVRYEARFDRFNPHVKNRWREHNIAGGGILYDLAPHLVDQAIHLLGAPDWVFCTLLTQRDGAQVNDGFEILMGQNNRQYPYITLGASQFSAAADQAYGAPKFKIQGRKATWLKSGFDPQESALRNGHIPQNIEWIAEDLSARGRLIDGVTGLDSFTDAGVGEWPRFYVGVKNAIEFNHAPPILSNEALMTCAVIDAALKSAETGKKEMVVK